MKRFAIIKGCPEEVFMAEEPEGGWVKWEDHQARAIKLGAERDYYRTAVEMQPCDCLKATGYICPRCKTINATDLEDPDDGRDSPNSIDGSVY